MTKITPTFPQKRIISVPMGRTNCAADWNWGINMMPTDGSGIVHQTDCTGKDTSYNYAAAGAPASNELAYFLGANPTKTPYTMLWKADFISLVMYPQELKTLGAGNTKLDHWKAQYIDYSDAHGLKWMLDIENPMYGAGIQLPDGVTTMGAFQKNTPGTDQSWYTPPNSTFATSYEASLCPAFNFIESSACNKNFLGYHMEYVHINALKWLYARTNYRRMSR